MVLVVWATMYIAAGAQGPRPAKAPTKTSSHHTQAAHPHGKHAAKERAEPFVNQGPMAPAPEVAATNVGAQAAADATPPGEPVAVTYEQGALAITTHDAPLRDVLNKVGETTGAVVETPALEQSVTVNVPAQAPVQAIAALLDGLHLDYAMSGGTGEGDPVRRIIISMRGGAMRGGPAMAALVGPSGFQQRTPGVTPSEQTGKDEGVMEAAPARPARDH